MSPTIPSTYGEDFYGSGLYGGTAIIPGTTIAGTGGGLTAWWEVWRATIDNQMLEDITARVTGGGVDMNLDRAITTQATFELSDVAVINPYADYLAVFQNREYDYSGIVERDQLGLFTTPVPSGQRTIQRAEGVYTGYDLTAVLARRAFTDTYNITASTNYRTAVLDILALAGITRHAIEATDKVLATPLTFTVGQTYLEACNILLEAIDYYYLSVTPDGKPASGRGRNVQYVEPFRVVGDDDIVGDVSTQPTDTTVANIVIVIQDSINEAPLTAVRENSAADSPTSSAVLGPITRVETRSNLAGQDEVDALADRLLAEGRTFYQVASIRTLPDPRVLIPHQTVDLALTGRLAIFNGRWWVRTARIGFSPDAAGPVMEVNRVTDAIRGAII